MAAMGNYFIGSLEENMRGIFNGIYLVSPPCAEEVKPMFQEFFDHLFNLNINWNGSDACWYLLRLGDILSYLAKNTSKFEPFSPNDIASFKKLFSELSVLSLQILKYKNTYSLYVARTFCSFNHKLSIVEYILWKNVSERGSIQYSFEGYCDKLLVRSYESLWKIINYICSNWDRLAKQPSMNLIDNYFKSLEADRKNGTEKTEDEKVQDFITLINGLN